MKKTKRKFFSRFDKKTTVLSDIYSSGFRIEYYSPYDAVVYGIKCINDYSDVCVVLSHKNGSITFRGQDLCCDYYVEGAVSIKGNIASMHLE